MLFLLLRSAVSGESLTDEEARLYNRDMQKSILDAAKRHDVGHLAALGLKNNGLLEDYALSKIFIPYDTIKFHYPILQKYRFLTPIMEVRRWGKLIFCGHLKRTVKELKFNVNISK